MISEALVAARAELTSLRAREAELEAQIAEAEAALGTPTTTTPATKMTLHKALALLLEEAGDEGLTARELATAVTERGLYRRGDGSPVEPNQIHARANNYSDVFEKHGSKIRLRKESPMLTALPAELTLFRDDDQGFFAWLDDNPNGYFINTERSPNPNYLVLHRPDCPHFKGSESLHWTKDYIKICAPDRASLETWATNEVQGEVTLCRSCFG